MQLIISTAMGDCPSLASAIARFSNAGLLVWLDHTNTTIPRNEPIISTLHKIPESSQITFIIAPSKECIILKDIPKRMFRVIERGNLEEDAGQAQTVRLDNFGQLEGLLTLEKYTGLSHYLESYGWLANDFRDAILKRFDSSLRYLQNARCAVIFGAQRLGETVLQSLQTQGVSVKAFVDNNPKKHGTTLHGVPVCALHQITDKEIPIVIATTRFSNSIANQLENERFVHALPYSVMSLVDPTLYPDEIPYIDIQEDFARNMAEYIGLFLCLADEKSRKVLDGLLNYRQSYDTRCACAIADEYSRQYFDEELIKFSGSDVFVDLGGYDGDTAEKFIQYADGAFKKIYIFEPDSKLLELAAHRLKDVKSSIEFISAGAYSKDGELRFSATGRTNGSITDDGEIVIPVHKVDSVVTDPPTLIKMDIEGAETEALHGASNTLRTVQPKLAIAAYHFASDLWKLVNLVREINPSYKFYLRHYSENGLESVIYAI